MDQLSSKHYMFRTTYNGSKEVLAVTVNGTDLSIALEGEVR